MEIFIRGTSTLGNQMVKVPIGGPMAKSMRVTGKMASNMVLVLGLVYLMINTLDSGERVMQMVRETTNGVTATAIKDNGQIASLMV